MKISDKIIELSDITKDELTNIITKEMQGVECYEINLVGDDPGVVEVMIEADGVDQHHQINLYDLPTDSVQWSEKKFRSHIRSNFIDFKYYSF